MRVPDRLQPLLDYGVIEDVLRPLMSGKEAEVFLVVADGEQRVAKVYKNAQHRSFQNRAEYTEGRRVRSSREQRAMSRGSKHGRAKTEEAWRSAEVDAIHLLRAANVRVPEPFAFAEGVLVMELVCGADGEPAPRMVDINFTEEEATELFHILLREVVKMLCAGIVHADLSDFNVLITPEGPVIIDFPQAIDPARNQGASKMLIRDVNNLTSFLGRFAPALRRTEYGPEMWELYERSELLPDTELTGTFTSKKPKAEVSGLLAEIMEIEQEARERREALGLPPPRPARKPVVFVEAQEPAPRSRRGGGGSSGGGRGGGGGRPEPGRGGAAKGRGAGSRGPDRPDQNAGPPSPAPAPGAGEDAPKKRRRRRRRSGGEGSPAGAAPSNDRGPQADRSGGDRPRGDRPSGDRPRGDRSSGDRPRGDRPSGDRPRGDRPERPPPSDASGIGPRPDAPPGEGGAPKRRRRRRRRGGSGGNDGPPKKD